MSLPPAARTSPSPPNPPFPPPGGAGELLPSTLKGRGLRVGRARVQRGWGVPALPLPLPTPSCPPVLVYSPLEMEDLLFSIIYNLRLGPPVSFFPINLSDLRERQTDRCPTRMVGQGLLLFIT